MLDRVVTKSLHAIEMVLDLDLPSMNHDHYGRILSAIKDAGIAGTNLGLKANENRFRKPGKNILEELKKLMAEADTKFSTDLIDVTPILPT